MKKIFSKMLFRKNPPAVRSEVKKYHFVDAQLMARLHTTFDAPSEGVLSGIGRGDYVKVCCNSERFWCEVVTVSGDNIAATVSNELVKPSNKDLFIGAFVSFKKENVYSIIKEGGAEYNDTVHPLSGTTNE